MNKKNQKNITRFLLRPLSRRKRGTSNKKALLKALNKIEERAKGVDFLRKRLPEFKNDLEKQSGPWETVESVRSSISKGRALYESRVFSYQQYVFYVLAAVESLRTYQLISGTIPDLNQISEKINAIEKKHGLKKNEYWSQNQGPAEYQRLTQEYSRALDESFISTLRIVGLEELANLKSINPVEFDRIHERGRRNFFHENDKVHALKDLVLRYEMDARLAAASKAYLAAVALLGSGTEGLLLLRCLRSSQRAKRVAQQLPKKIRPKKEIEQWKFETLIEVCLRAGWLKNIETPMGVYNSAGLAHLLRQIRNNIHPGRRLNEKPWIEMEERDYSDAHAIYVVLLSVLGGISKRNIENTTDAKG